MYHGVSLHAPNDELRISWSLSIKVQRRHTPCGLQEVRKESR